MGNTKEMPFAYICKTGRGTTKKPPCLILTEGKGVFFNNGGRGRWPLKVKKVKKQKLTDSCEGGNPGGRTCRTGRGCRDWNTVSSANRCSNCRPDSHENRQNQNIPDYWCRSFHNPWCICRLSTPINFPTCRANPGCWLGIFLPVWCPHWSDCSWHCSMTPGHYQFQTGSASHLPGRNTPIPLQMAAEKSRRTCLITTGQTLGYRSRSHRPPDDFRLAEILDCANLFQVSVSIFRHTPNTPCLFRLRCDSQNR